MRCIDIEFRRADQWGLVELMDQIGVYSIWSGNADVRPSYIGEGYILHRIVNEHHSDSNKASRNTFDGAIGILGEKRAKIPKQEAEIVEALLLYVAREIDRYPTHNRSFGKHSRIERVLANHATLRVAVRGLDPLRQPESAPITGKKLITIGWRRNGEIFVEHDWNMRPR